MTDHFADRLISSIESKSTCVVAGLDPRIARLPEPLREQASRSRSDAADAIESFNRQVIEAVAPFVVAVKPQVAFYENLGWQGWRAFERTVTAAKEADLLVIADMKRGDIGSTAEAYAQACFQVLDADAVTVNAYLGSDGIMPFAQWAIRGKGLFVLVKTSNPSSAEVQDILADGAPIYERMAQLVKLWGRECRGERGYDAVGAVAGATYPQQLERLRSLMPETLLLVPGYGAQGGSAADCSGAFDKHGLGAVVNSSRGIIYAFEKSPSGDWQAAVEEAAKQTRDDLEAVRLPKATSS